MKFIQFNNRIFDFNRYCEEVTTLKRIFLIDIKQYFESFGFELTSKKQSSYSNAELVFYNKTLDLKATLLIKKKSNERFV